MFTGLFISVTLFSLILLAVGLHYALKKKGEESELKEMQHNSGVFSIVRVSPRKAVLQLKPTGSEVYRWLEENRPDLPEPLRREKADEWDRLTEEAIALVEKADRDGRNTFRYQTEPKEEPLLPFITADGYITRETIFEHPELLPPFFIGCRTRLMLKEADSALQGGNTAKCGWKPMLPSPDGTYPIPDWRAVPPRLD